MARAVMEGVAFNLRQILDITRATGARIDEMRLIGGATRNSVWPQIIADAFEMPVALPESPEGTAIGAAHARRHWRRRVRIRRGCRRVVRAHRIDGAAVG